MGEPSSCKQTSKHPGTKLWWLFMGSGPYVSKASGENESLTVQKLANHDRFRVLRFRDTNVEILERSGLTMLLEGLADLSILTANIKSILQIQTVATYRGNEPLTCRGPAYH